MEITKEQQIKMNAGIDYNLRGINTYNLLKRVIWSCVTHRPSGELDEHCEVNLDLLKGIINEIYSEVYVEDSLKRISDNDSTYDFNIDVNDYEGFSVWNEVTDHDCI